MEAYMSLGSYIQDRSVGMDRRAQIYQIMRENPKVKLSEIAKTLGLNKGTVSRHCKAIRNGWAPYAGCEQ